MPVIRDSCGGEGMRFDASSFPFETIFPFPPRKDDQYSGVPIISRSVLEKAHKQLFPLSCCVKAGENDI